MISLVTHITLSHHPWSNSAHCSSPSTNDSLLSVPSPLAPTTSTPHPCSYFTHPIIPTTKPNSPSSRSHPTPRSALSRHPVRSSVSCGLPRSSPRDPYHLLPLPPPTPFAASPIPRHTCGGRAIAPPSPRTLLRRGGPDSQCPPVRRCSPLRSCVGMNHLCGAVPWECG